MTGVATCALAGNAFSARLKLPVVRYVTSMVASYLLNGVSGLVVLRFLDPLMVGWWNTAQLVKIPLDLTRMGILNGLNREYPFLIGAGKPEKAHRMLEAGLAHTLAMLLVGQVGTALAVVSLRDTSPNLLFGIVAASLIWGLTYYTQFNRAMLRSSVAFGRVGPLELAVTAVDAIAVLAVWKWGYWGLLVRGVFTAINLAAVFYWIRPATVSPHWDWKAMKHMFKFGRHAFLTNWLGLLGQQADRIWILAAVDGVRMLGLYSPAIFCMTFLNMIPGVVQNYYYPQWVESFGRHQDRRILARQIFREMSRVAVLMVPISAIAALGIDVLVKNFLPQYAAGERAAQLACLAGPLFSFRLYASYYAAVHQWKEYWIYTAMQTVLPFLLIPLFMIIIQPLESAVLGAVANLVLSGLALCFMTIRDVAKIPAQ